MMENGHFAFLNPTRVLWATYAIHLRLIGKRVVDFLLVIIELFSLGVTTEFQPAHFECDKSEMCQLATVW